MSPDIIRLIY